MEAKKRVVLHELDYGKSLRTVSREYGISKSTLQRWHSSVHSSTVVNEWLSKQEFTVLPWSSNSPDLNPIENVWAILKRTLNFNGVNELWDAIQRSWNDLQKDQNLEHSLIHSMPTRLGNVIANGGNSLKY
ncbi:unnamed protein product [Larinioides sclopetarius]|uniref:Tc1-like transposase DDE domain-containing protein n=1 Tax=Larinioides sclopetarius TaxID=280406 RepID=A0AAV2B7Y0_9ARAC